jgi:hypothetical protein
MKRKFFLAVVAISLRAACGQAEINTIVEAKITNSTPDLIRYRSAFTRISKVERAPGNMASRKSTIFKVVGVAAPDALVTFRFDNLGLNVDGQRNVLTCDSARYVCTIRSVRDDYNEKRCLFGYSIFIMKK